MTDIDEEDCGYEVYPGSRHVDPEPPEYCDLEYDKKTGCTQHGLWRGPVDDDPDPIMPVTEQNPYRDPDDEKDMMRDAD